MTARETAPVPYPFTQDDLDTETLISGAKQTLEQYYQWKDANPELIEAHIRRCDQILTTMEHEYRFPARLNRIINPSQRAEFQNRQMTRQLSDFSVRNMAQIPDPEMIDRITGEFLSHTSGSKAVIRHLRHPLASLTETDIFSLNDETRTIIEDSWKRLYRILPEEVIRKGAMGKIGRTMLGIGVIAAFDLADATPEEKREHFPRALLGGFLLGAGYTIIDDSIQDSSSTSFISEKERNRIHTIVESSLETGLPIDPKALPAHPLAEELNTLYTTFRHYFPIGKYPHLYQAAKALYQAQHHDSWSIPEGSERVTVKDMYPDIFVKAAMTRVIANILGRRSIDDELYQRCINVLIVSQLKDDAVDYLDDLAANRLTPFTHPFNPEDTNPLYDIFAYDAFMTATLFPGTEDILAYSQAVFFSWYLSRNPTVADTLLNVFGNSVPQSVHRFITHAAHLPASFINRAIPADQDLRREINTKVSTRNPNDADPRTYMLDNNIDERIISYLESIKGDESLLTEVRNYVVESGGKRIRPALTLMLAEGMGISTSEIVPLLAASELFHSASLMLDDLPWHDDGRTRRGKPTAQTIYPPVTVELASIHTILEGIQILQNLKDRYRPEDILTLNQYVTEAIKGACLGQDLDLHMTAENADIEGILRMYHLKTSLAIEASLIPLMILERRPQSEIDSLKKFAHHAGLVFQMKDDLLDIEHNAEMIGKGVNQDTAKINLPRLIGTEATNTYISFHLGQAIAACYSLPFNTNLLQGIVQYFAGRRK